MLRCGRTKVAKEKSYGAKRLINIWMLMLIIIVILILFETKTSPKYLIGYITKVIRPSMLILSKLSGYIKTFEAKDAEKGENSKLMSFRMYLHKRL